MTESEIADAREALTGFAHLRGLSLGQICVEQSQQAPAAYDALIDALVDQHDVAAVIVPTLQHLALGVPPSYLRRHLERHAGVEVIVMADYGH